MLVLAANGQHVRYDILAHLKKIQALLSVYDALKISAELRMSLVYANPEEFSNEVNQVEMRSSEPTYAECLALITFTDDYLQPGLIKHNRPLFISGYLNGLEITRIMIDGGSAVNLLPLRMLKRLGGLLFIDWPQAIYLSKSKDFTKVGRGLRALYDLN